MSVRSRSTLAGAAAFVALLPAAAHAASIGWVAEVHSNEPLARGSLCKMEIVSDPTGEAGTRSGTLSGGPVALLDPRAPAATLICRIQTFTADHTGSGPEVRAHGAVVIPHVGPQVVNITVFDTDPVYLCAELASDTTGTYYWDGEHNTWSTNIGVKCTQVDPVATP